MAYLINELSVFLPAYNEEKNLGNTLKKIKEVLLKVAQKWEIIVVDDGSSDGTGKIADKIAYEDQRIKVIHHDSNRGYGAALKSGLYHCKYNWISFTDSDGQFDFSEIISFIRTQKETKADLVIGYYRKRMVSKFKIITSKVWELLVFFLFGLKVKDIDCGFKFFSKKVVEKIPRLESERGAFISSEFLIKAKKKGFKIIEIPVNHYPRKEGVGTGRNLNVILQSFIDLFKLWVKLI